MRPDVLEKIFERFYTDRPHQGFGQNSGLGLSISKQIVEAHGGTIWVENRTGAPDADGDADGARRALRRALAGDVMAQSATTVHASAVLVGARAVLIRGPSGAGKSRLALRTDRSGARGGLCALPGWSATTAFISKPPGGRLLVRPAEALAGLIEVRGVGIRRLDHEPRAVVGLVVDLAAADAERLPEAEQATRGYRRHKLAATCRRSRRRGLAGGPGCPYFEAGPKAPF